MADYTWSGAVSTSWATAGNWTPGGPPGPGDSVDIPLSATNDLLTNLDRQADDGGDGLHLTKFRVTAGSSVSVGSASAPLKITADDFIHLGNEAVYFNSEMGAGADTTLRVYLNSRRSIGALYLGGDVLCARVFLHRGGCVWSNTASGATFYVGKAQRTNGSRLTTSGSAPITRLVAHGGLATVGNVCVTTHLAHGTVTLDTTANPDYLVQGGGICIWNTTTSAINELLAGGRLDLTQTGGIKPIGFAYVMPAADIRYGEANITGLVKFVGENS